MVTAQQGRQKNDRGAILLSLFVTLWLVLWTSYVVRYDFEVVFRLVQVISSGYGDSGDGFGNLFYSSLFFLSFFF